MGGTPPVPGPIFRAATNLFFKTNDNSSSLSTVGAATWKSVRALHQHSGWLASRLFPLQYTVVGIPGSGLCSYSFPPSSTAALAMKQSPRGFVFSSNTPIPSFHSAVCGSFLVQGPMESAFRTR